MKYVIPQADWPESWKLSHSFDLQEVYGKITNLGYAYAYESRFKVTLDCIQEFLPLDSSVIDIAAGQGNFSLALAELGYKVIWNDLREDLADYVRLKHETGTINYIAGNAFDLGLKECFDCVLITEVIEHVAHPDEFLAKAAAIAKPGGFVVMSTPNGQYFRNSLPRFSECPDRSIYESKQFKPDADGHIFLLWPDEISWLAQATNMKIRKLVYHTNPLTNGHVKLEAALKVLPKRVVMAFERASQKLPLIIRLPFTTSSVTVFQKQPIT
jgi:2-polyprenyl-6-hydroxyphenyl methylase/3-demethylubiquinone-9 3-methyltransferase